MADVIKTPSSRVRALWALPFRTSGEYVLYWMTATRRAKWNFALDRSVQLARDLKKPLVILEALRLDYPWASERLHKFVLQGMDDNRRSFAETCVTYYPYIEPEPRAGSGLLRQLASRACVVVTDDSPQFFMPAMLAAARLEVDCRFEAVDSIGLLPLRSTGKAFSRAFDFRRFLQRNLGQHLTERPGADSLAGLELPRIGAELDEVKQRWPEATPALLMGEPLVLAELAIDHAVPPTNRKGGAASAEAALSEFVGEKLPNYDEHRNRPEQGGTSGLSAYLHFGHLSPHQVFAAIAAREGWTPDRLGDCRNGERVGWWGLDPSAASFLDQLVTWRELGLNVATHQPDYDKFASIPAWAKKTLADHADDERPYTYSLAQFEKAETHDELWNAAQQELRTDGVIHGYLRMLWGKKILHWSPSPQAAHEVMLELNNKYALDGRDPNSHSGILWTLGKFDRAWGPERDVFGKVRTMTSSNTRRKLRVSEYIARWTRNALS